MEKPSVFKRNNGGNLSVCVKKIENALDGAVNEKTKVTLALTRMEDELKEILQGMARSDTWFNWKKEAAQILQTDRNVHERLSKVRALAMERKNCHQPSWRDSSRP